MSVKALCRLAIIQQAAAKHHLPYQETTLWRMLHSHFSFLKLMATTDKTFYFSEMGNANA
jgi:hypothetical protein